MNWNHRGRVRRRESNGTEGTPSRRGLQSCLLALLTSCTLASCAVPGSDAAEGETPPFERVRPGIEVLLSDSLHLIRGLRAGLITNHTGRDGEGRSDIDLLAEHAEVELAALYSPEHGIRGIEEGGAHVQSGTDSRTGLPLHSLYGETLKPTPEMLEGIEVLLFDMQDIGARFYTYVSTMALAMEAAGEAGIPFLVLDRPNPVRGDVVQGTVLDPAFATFVGKYPVPMRHGMTVGELARMYVGEFGVDADLHVVPVEGWSRSMTYHETGLPWIPPSPNIPSLESALAYPGTCLFEGTPLSVGRGTDRAFQWVGAPWLDGSMLASALNAYGIDDMRFEAVSFVPRDPGDAKYPDTEVYGVQLIPSSSTYDAPRVAVAMLVETYRMSGGNWSWRASHFDRLAGTDELRLGIEDGRGLDDLTTGWDDATAAFRARRAPYLIYR
jgi:uncharacterized protein YbbC (DUF1343 family)